MKATKLLPILAVVLCVPGIALRALHLLNGFDVSTGLPTAGDKWNLVRNRAVRYQCNCICCAGAAA